MLLRYGVIGTGAIGGYYGAKLAHAGKDVHFLLHSDYDYVRTHGLQVDSVNGDFVISKVNAYHDTINMPKCDVVMVCLKSVNNALLKQLLPPLLCEKTLIVLVQNGIGLESDLQKEFPTLYIAAGLAFICSSKHKKGIITHQSFGKLTVAPYSCQDKDLINQFLSDLIEAGIESAVAEYETARWKKAVWNIPFNGLTVALNTTTDKLLSNQFTEQLIYEMMLEVIFAANKIGDTHIDESFADIMIKTTKAMPPYSPSMKLDFDNHRAMEIYYLYSRPVAEAKKVGFAMPLTSMLEKQLAFIQSCYL